MQIQQICGNIYEKPQPRKAERHVGPKSKQSVRVAVITGPIVIERNMEHVLYRICLLLSKCYDVDLVGPIKVSTRLEEMFRVYPAISNSNFLARLLPALGPRLAAVKQYVKANRPDVFMAVSAIGINGLAAALAGRYWRRPVIVRVTSDVFQVHKSEKRLSRKVRMFVRNNLMGRLSMLLADRIVALHENQARELRKRPGLSRKVFVVSQPVAFPATLERSKKAKKIRRRFGIPENAYLVGYVGRLDYGKKPALFLETVNMLLANEPSLHVLVVGDGAYRHWLEKKITCFDRVHFVGQQPRDELVFYYSAMDVVLHTSISEGLSSVIAEALFLGVPVVASDSGSITRGLVSNVAASSSELAKIILSRNYVVDRLPDYMSPEVNASLWIELIEKTYLDNAFSAV